MPNFHVLVKCTNQKVVSNACFPDVHFDWVGVQDLWGCSQLAFNSDQLMQKEKNGIKCINEYVLNLVEIQSLYSVEASLFNVKWVIGSDAMEAVHPRYPLFKN